MKLSCGKSGSETGSCEVTGPPKSSKHGTGSEDSSFAV